MRLKLKGNMFIMLVGYLLSPVSWWNDLVLNIPLSYVLAWPFGLLSKKLFMPIMIIMYWLTNLLGFVLLHYGIASSVISKQAISGFDRKFWLKNFIISIVYTACMAVAIKLNWLKLPTEYFNN